MCRPESNAENDADNGNAAVASLTTTHMPSTPDSASVGEAMSSMEMRRTIPAHETPCFATRTAAATTATTAATVETILPNVLWLEQILPCLDRSSWNSLMEASKKIYMLALVSKLTADFHQRIGPVVAQPPWPTNLSLKSTIGGQDQAIESFTMSHDGEFLACGSVIGSIDIWNLRTGKLLWKKTHPLGNEEAELRAQRPNYYASRTAYDSANTPSMERRSTPIGSVLRFSPEGYTLACGFENRVFVWDLAKDFRMRRRRRTTMIRNSCQSPDSRNTSSHAFPPQPQLRDDRLEQSSDDDIDLHVHPHLRLIKPSPAHRVYANRRREELLQHREQEEEDSFQILQIDCRKGTIYEVTYLGFSNGSGREAAGSRLIARYGKMAYLWTKEASDSCSRYSLTHTIALTSSRCQMVSNPSLTSLAVATSAGRRRNNGETEGVQDPASKAVDGKGTIHVWDITSNDCDAHADDPRYLQDGRSPKRISAVSCACGSKIVAYRNHVVRGLEFIEVGATGSGNCKNDTYLVSASLQGEVKFWKKQSTESGYVCAYRFQSPGKIFSLASWSPRTPSGIGGGSSSSSDKILLAAGEARGQVRVWKLSPRSLVPDNDSPPGASSSSTRVFCKPQHGNTERPQVQSLEECLSTAVGDHVHYDNIKLLAFTPNGKSLAVSRAYDAKIWFQTVWQ